MEQYVLHVTHECNLRCKYCYETERNITYTKEEILSTCDDIIDTKEPFSVEFIGGEPLLAFNHIVTAYNYIKSKSNLVQGFCISTNLTILNDDIIEFLKENRDITVSISVDGNKYMNQLRVTKSGLGTHDLVMKNIRTLLSEIGDDRAVVHMVAHPYNVGYLLNGIKYLYDNGVRHIAVGIIESTISIGSEFAERYISELNKVSKEILINGGLGGLHISELEGLKPESDIRTYVYDDDGKIIFESYGRAKDDSVTRGQVNAVPVSGESTEIIKYIRRTVYNIHQSRISRINHDPIVIDDLTLKSVKRHELDKSVMIKDTLSILEDEFPFDCDIHTIEYSPDIFTTVIILKDIPGVRCNGKGVTAEASEVSAIAEVIERLSSFQFPMPLYGFTNNVNKLLEYAQYKNMEFYDKVCLDLPELRNAEKLLGYDRRKCYSLISESPIGVNVQLVHLDQGSNGVAAGNCYEEAIVQAVCEVFERFCLYCSATEKIKLFPTIDTSTIKNDIIQRQLEFYRSKGYKLWIKDVGMNVFPVWGILFENTNKPNTDPSRYTYVCAGSFNSDTAIIRCLTEKAQIGINHESADLSDEEPLKDLVDGGRTKLNLENLKLGKMVSYNQHTSDNFLNDIYETKIICLELGVDLVIIDHTMHGFPVVSVVIPELSSTGKFYSYDKVINTIESVSRYNLLIKEK